MDTNREFPLVLALLWPLLLSPSAQAAEPPPAMPVEGITVAARPLDQEIGRAHV